MAPRTRSSVKPRKTKTGRKKRVSFHKKDHSIEKSQAFIKQPKNYENLIRYYFTKLKRLFGSADEVNQSLSEIDTSRMLKTCVRNQCGSIQNLSRMSSSTSARLTNSKPKLSDSMDISNNRDLEMLMREKAFNIVSSALEYGFANDILEKRGDYFILKNRRNLKMAIREPTPGPSVFNKALNSVCKCVNCTNRRSIIKLEEDSLVNKHSEKLDRKHSVIRPQSARLREYNLRSTPSRTNSIIRKKSKSCSGDKDLKHNSAMSCRCSTTRSKRSKM